MDIHAATTGWFSSILPRLARHVRGDTRYPYLNLIRHRFGGVSGISDEQVEIIEEQAWAYLRSMRSEAREKRPEPKFYLVDALRHADFKPELNVARYREERALHDRIIWKTVFGRHWR